MATNPFDDFLNEYTKTVDDRNAQRRADLQRREEEKRRKEEEKKRKQQEEAAKASSKSNTGIKPLDTVLNALEFIDRPADAFRSGVKSLSEGDGFLSGAKKGLTGKTDTSGKEMNRAVGFNPEEDKTDKVIARLLGDTVTGTIPLGQWARPFLEPKIKERIGEEAAALGTEGTLDPLNLIGLGLGSKIVNSVKTGAKKIDKAADVVKKLEDVTVDNVPKVEMPAALDEAVQADLQNTETMLDDLFKKRQVEEDAFVSERMKPFDEELTKQAQAEQEWQAVKQLQDEGRKVQKAYGKIYVPEGNQADWQGQVPKRFLAGKNRKDSAYDIYKAAEEEGFTSVDEFVEYLKRLDGAMNTKLKDLTPENSLGMKAGDYESLTDAYRQEFGNTETAKGIDTLFNDLVNTQKQLDPRPTEPDVSGLDETLNFLNEPTPVKTNAQTTGTGTPLGSVSGNVATPTTPMGGAIDHRGARLKGKKSVRDKEGWIKKIFNSFSEHVIDDTARVKSIENQLEGRGRLDEAGDLYKRVSVGRGVAGEAEYTLNNDYLPVFQKVTEAGEDLDNALDYIYAIHLKEVHAAKAADGVDYIIPGGKTVQDLDATIQMFQGNQVMDEFVDNMRLLLKQNREELVEAGRISRQLADELEAKYPTYMPKFRAQDVDDFDTFEQTFFNDYQPISSKDIIKGVKEGSTDPLMDPIESIRLLVLTSKQSAANNRALQELKRLSDLDTEGIWISKTPKGAKGGTPMHYYIDGKKETVYVEKELAEALSRATSFEKDAMTGFFKGAAKLQRLSITGNPAFAIRNFIRDVSQGWQYSKAGLTGRDIAHAMIDLFSNGKYVSQSNVEDFYRSGAGMNSVWSQDSKAFRKFQQQAYKENKKGFIDVEPGEIKTARMVGNLLDAYRDNIMNNLEQVVKLAEFRASKRKGMSDLDAAFNARDMLDFFRAGKWTRKVNPWLSFLNVTIRGREKFARSLVEYKGKDRARVVFRSLMSGAAPSALAYMAYQNFATEEQKKIISEAPHYLRDTYWLLPHTNGKDVVRIPKPFETAAYVSTPLEAALRDMDGQNVEVQNEIQNWVVKNVLFDPSLNIATPLYEMATGVDTFTDKQIVPSHLKNLPPVNQKDAYTTKPAEAIAGMFGSLGLDNTKLASPMQIDNLIEGYLPVAGPQVSQTVDRALGKLGLTEPNNAPEGSYKNPFNQPLEQFFVRGEGRSTPLLGKFYEAPNKYRGLKEINGGQFPSSEMKANYDRLNKAVSAVNDIGTAIREITNDPNKNGEQKQQEINRLIEERNRIVRIVEEEGLLNPK